MTEETDTRPIPLQAVLEGMGARLTRPLTSRDTSADAERSIRPAAATLRAQVLALLIAAGMAGLTDEEVQDALAMNPSTERPRRLELESLGFVAQAGGTRLTRSGRKAIVWIATQRGVEFARG